MEYIVSSVNATHPTHPTQKKNHLFPLKYL